LTWAGCSKIKQCNENWNLKAKNEDNSEITSVAHPFHDPKYFEKKEEKIQLGNNRQEIRRRVDKINGLNFLVRSLENSGASVLTIRN
jgi:hypothetical protein